MKVFSLSSIHIKNRTFCFSFFQFLSLQSDGAALVKLWSVWLVHLPWKHLGAC